jgi:hypothetical protein
MAKYNSQGWHFQSERHSRARRTGVAGGEYSSARIQKIVSKHPEYKNLTFKQLQKKGVFLKYQSDADKDGVKNVKDCRPLNKKAQDNGMSKEEHEQFIDDINLELAKSKKDTELIKPKEHGKVYNWIKKEEEIIGEKIKEGKARRAEAREKASQRHVTELNTGLKKKIETEEEIDVRTLSDSELHKLAIIEGNYLFGDNPYEKELKRRIDTADRLDTDLAIERIKSKKDASERFKAEKKRTEEGGWF